MITQQKVIISKREFECLSHLSKGFTAKEIARELKLSPRTIEYHIHRIRLKTDLHRKSQLVRFFIENNLYLEKYQ